MKEVTAYVWLTNPDRTGDESPQYVLNSIGTMESVGWFKVKEVSVSFEEPSDAQVIPAVVSALRAQIIKTRADSERQCTQIETQIQNLLSITLDPGVSLNSPEFHDSPEAMENLKSWDRVLRGTK